MHARVNEQTSKIYKISKEVLKLNFNEQQNVEESARSELYDALGVDQLAAKFDNLLYIDDSWIDSTAQKFNNINKSLLQKLDKPKHKNLSINQMKFLSKLLNKNSNRMHQLCYLFDISYSSYYRIKRMNFHQYYGYLDEERENDVMNDATKYLRVLLTPPKLPTTIKQITQKVNDFLCSHFSSNFIRKLIKNKLNYSFKRGWSRVLKADCHEYNCMRRIFSSKLLIELTKDSIIYNIDESSFNRSLKKEYSCLPKGWSGRLLNIASYSRCSLILAMGSDGQWIGMIKTNTVNSVDHSSFLTLLGYLMSLRGISVESDLILTIDNASIHSSKDIHNIMRRLKVKMWFIPPYSPSLAPVEIVFRIINRK